MPVVWVPGLLRDLTGGQARVQAEGNTVREAIENLEARYPGILARLVEDGQLRPTLTVMVDGEPATLRLRQPVNIDSEVHFLPAISGGGQ
jgi:molybdopterin converting factor small subunit